MWLSTKSIRSCAATAAGRRSALSSGSRAWQACSPAASVCRQPSATPSARAPSCRRGRDATASSPVLRSRAACGASPWSTSTTRVPRRSSEDSRAQVRRKLRCSHASALRQRHQRHCPPAPKTCVTADSSHKRSAVNVVSGHGARPHPRTAELIGPRGRSRHPTSDRAGASQPHRHGARQRRPRYGLYL